MICGLRTQTLPNIYKAAKTWGVLCSW